MTVGVTLPKFLIIPKETCKRNKRRLLIWLSLVIFSVILFHWSLFQSELEIPREVVKLIHVDTELVEINRVKTDTVATAKHYFSLCKIERWNNLTIENVPHESLRKSWIAKHVGSWFPGNWNESELRVVSAFVYKEEIVVTTTTQNRYGKTVYCRYFDCNRIEIPNSTYQSVMFPLSSAYCARRAGAQFMGLTETINETVVDPVPLTFRAFDKPVHEVSVCVGPLYGEESRWLEIVETTEHHILMGINYFYFTVFNQIDSHTRRLLDDYEQTHTAEVAVIGSEYETMDWMFHMIQITDCFFRARHHSKWILNVDIDERLVMTRMPLPLFLKTIPDDVGEISFSTSRVARTKPLPKKYAGLNKLKSQLLFLNYKASTWRSFSQMKGLVRPDKTDAMFYHFTWAQYPGVRVMSASRKVGTVKHYRTTLPSLAHHWSDHELKFRPFKFDPTFEKELLEAITRKIRRVYDQRLMWCDEMTPDFLNMFSKDNYNCVWKRNGTQLNS